MVGPSEGKYNAEQDSLAPICRYVERETDAKLSRDAVTCMCVCVCT